LAQAFVEFNDPMDVLAFHQFLGQNHAFGCCFGGNQKKNGGMDLLKSGGDLISELGISYF